MSIQDWVSVTAFEGQSIPVRARVRDVNDALITQATVSTVKYRVVASSTEVVALTSLTKADVIFDTLQTEDDDAGWKEDEVGYNFKYIFPPATIPDGGKEYFIPIEFTDTSGRISILGVKVTTRESYLDTPAP